MRQGQRLRRIKEGKFDEIDSFIDDKVNGGKKSIHQVAGRTFYLSGSRWIEGGLDHETIKTAKKVSYMSDDYFKLLKDHSGIGRILGMGSNIVFRWQGEIFEVRA